MLHSIIRFSLTQRLFIGIIALLIIGLGTNAWLKLPIDAFPDISPTQVKVILKAPGMTAEEIELQITRPIETELLGIPNKDMLRSMTKYSIADITIDFIEGTDIYWARQQVNERLSSLWGSLPENISGGVAPMSTPLSEMFMFTIESDKLSLLEQRQLLDWEIRPLLRTIEGVADVNVLGGYAKTYTISPDAALMSGAGVSFEELETAIQNNNLNAGLGRIEQGNDTLIIRSEGRRNNLQQLSDIVVKVDNHQVYRLNDLAEVSIGHLTRFGAVTKDGEEATEALVIALKNANTADVIEFVKEKLAIINMSLPEGTRINVFYDRKRLIDTAIGTISNALAQSVILVVILLATFLGNIRSAVVVSLSLPFAALCTFYLMSESGLTANLMSLGGLVIAIGMIVDSSVVVVENIVSQLSRQNNLPRLHVIYRATKEVAVPVFSGTIIVAIVFSPLLILTGLEGKLFSPVAMTIVFAMLSALILSLTLVPMFASILLKGDTGKEPRLIHWLKKHYQQSLQHVFLNPIRYGTIAFTCLLVSFLLFAAIGKIFMPTMDEGDIIVQLEKSPNISLQASIELDKQIENALLEKVPEIIQIVARTGSDEMGLDPMSLNETDIFMELKPLDEWRFDSKSELINAIRKVLSAFPGISYGFTQPIQMRVSEMISGSTGDVSVKVFGNDIASLADLAEKISNQALQIKGNVDVQTAIIEGGRFLNIQLNPEIALQYGMTVAELSRYLKSQLDGVVVSEIIQGKIKTPVLFGVPEGSNMDISTVKELEDKLLLMPDKSLQPLHYIAEVTYKEGPSIVERENGERFAVVTMNVINRDVASFVESLKQSIQTNIKLPSGYYITYGGEFENQQRAMNNLLLVVPVAVGLIMIILFSTFRSLRVASLIIANVPFALMGGIIALFISGEYLSVPASVGFIALLGVAVLNSVVMISHFENTKLNMKDLANRVLNGSVRRFRPVLMTATTAVFGLMPLVYASGPGAEVQKPLAIVVIGGLLTSTITTLYLLPMFYRLLEMRYAK